MIDSILSQIFSSQWRVIVIVSALLLATAEAGFRRGLRLHRTKDDARRGQIGGVQGAIFGLLGLLLGFTFAMSVARFDARRGLVLEEANAIGTTFLRAALLPESHQVTVEKLLREYVEVRLEFYRPGTDESSQALVESETAKLQRALWSHAVAAGKEAPSPLTTSFITSLNDTIDLDTKQLNAMRAHVPGAVWLLVLAVAVSGAWACGYSAGSSGARSSFSNFLLPLLIAVAITLIADLDRPRKGLIGVSQRPLLDLKASIQPETSSLTK